MSVEDEDLNLKDLVTKALQSTGVLGKIQAQLRASIFLALDEEFRDKANPLVSKKATDILSTTEGALAASLVYEFMQYLGLEFTLAVFTPESGQSAFWDRHSRENILSALHLRQETDEPLLLQLLKRTSGSDKPCTPSNVNVTTKIATITDTKLLSKGPDDCLLHNSAPPLAPVSLPPIQCDSNKNLSRLNLELTSNAPSAAKISDVSDISERSSLLEKISVPDDKKPTVESGEENYEEDFSGSVDKEEEGEDTDKEDEEEIEEDLSIDELITSSTSIVSEHTKDISLSQATQDANYQEDL